MPAGSGCISSSSHDEAPTQRPTRVRRGRRALAASNIFTEPPLIRCLRRVCQDNFGRRLLPNRRCSSLFDEFQFDRSVDVTFLVRVSEKPTDGRASGLTVIPSEFIYVHADEFTGELRVHVARVSERIGHRFIPMRQTVIDALANNVAEIATDRWRNIFAHYVSTQRQWQSGLPFPPFAKVDDLLKTGSGVGELPLV